uniref:ribosomal protein L6 n=1 Tax=Navicula tsukamotoi TaxID=2018706 RepID=UPI00202860C2|nr:ribosomal protein L6 [Navicula tsukamotoi]QYB23089.1 ribosomal protein L6 [Navicula tsukamotoi]
MKKQKYNLRIPQNVSLIFCKKKSTLTVKGPLKKKSLKLKLKIYIDKFNKVISVSPIPIFKGSNVEKKQIKILRKTTFIQIKQLVIESSVLIFQKLKIIGVGFRADFANTFLKKKILTLKLGFSHLVYVKVPENLNLNTLTKTKFCIYGNDYHKISEFTATIRSKKLPEPYKGKGILYDNENIILKEGKKI